MTNFEIALLVARQTAPRDFGVFSIGLTLYVALLWVSRSLCTEPYVVSLAAAAPEDQRAQATGATGAALTVGVFAGLIVVGVGIVVESPPAVLGAMALAMPALLLQDAFRYVMLAAGRSRSAALNDLLWLASQTVLAVALIWSGRSTAVLLTVAFGTGASVAAALGALQTRVLPKPRATRSWIHDHRELAIPFVLEFMAIAGSLQLVLLLVAAIAGVRAVGDLRAALILTGPLTVVFLGLYVLALPEAVRLRERSTAALRGLVRALGIAMPAATVLWTVAVLAVPNSVGMKILGPYWSTARRLLPVMAVLTAANSCALAAALGLRAVGAAKASLRARLRAAPFGIVGGATGAVLGAGRGAAMGLAVAALIDATLVWIAVSRAFRNEITAGQAAPSVASQPPL